MTSRIDRSLCAVFEAHARQVEGTLLPPEGLRGPWFHAEPLVRQLLWHDTVIPTEVPVRLSPLSGCRTPTGRYEILIAAHPHSGAFLPDQYLLPAPSCVDSQSASATWPSGWIDCGLGGAAFVVTLEPGRPNGREARLEDFNYVLLPEARQREDERFLSEVPDSIFEAIVAREILRRLHHLPLITSLARSEDPLTHDISYHIGDEDGWRHFFTVTPNDINTLDGIRHIESVPRRRHKPDLKSAPPHAPSTVEARFESFYTELGYAPFTIHPKDPLYEALRANLRPLLHASYPGMWLHVGIKIHCAFRSRDDTVLLVGLHDDKMRSFVPSDAADRFILDTGFAGLELHIAHPPSSHDTAPPSRWEQTRRSVSHFIRQLAPRGSAPFYRYEVHGPVLSDYTWQAELDHAERLPHHSYLTGSILTTLQRDLAPRQLQLTARDISAINPIRTVVGSDFWNREVVCIDHRFGTHIVEIPRHRGTGLVALDKIRVQQRFYSPTRLSEEQ